MKKFRTILKEYWPAIIMALFFSLIIVRPTLQAVLKPGFKGIYPMFNDDEVHYLAMAQELKDGHSLSNPYYFEHKNEPQIQPALVPWIMAKASHFFHVSIPKLFAINDLIFPLIGFLLLYGLILKITQSKKNALFFSSIFFLFFLFSFNRPINPQFSFLFIPPGLFLIFKLIDEQNQLKQFFFSLAEGLIIGILIYIYPYYWTALLLVFLLSQLFAMREKKLKILAVNFAACFAAIVMMAIPYIANFKRAIVNPDYNEAMLRFGLLKTHWPACYVNVSLVLAGLILILLLRKKISRKTLNFSLALILSALVLNWQNVITGQYLQFSSHYYQITILFILLVFSLLIAERKAWEFNEGRLKSKTWSAVLIIVIITIFVAYKQKGEIISGFSLGVNDGFKEAQSEKELFDWLNQNTDKDAVLFTQFTSEGLIPIYTHDNLFFYGYGGFYLLSDKEIETRWAIKNWLASDSFIADNLEQNQREIWLNKYIDSYQNNRIKVKILSLFKNNPPNVFKIPKEKNNQVEKIYFEVNNNPKNALKNYKIDYFILDKNDDQFENAEVKIKKYGLAILVKEINNFNIYKAY